MSIYEKTKCARALLYWAANNNGNEAYYLEDRMYAVADNGMVIILTADSYDEAKRKAKARHTPTVEPQNVVIIPHELIEKLALCVVDTVKNIDWDKVIEAYKERPQGEWEEPFEMIGKTYHKCTNCHISSELILIDKFCPNCGADMRGEDHENQVRHPSTD